MSDRTPVLMGTAVSSCLVLNAMSALGGRTHPREREEEKEVRKRKKGGIRERKPYAPSTPLALEALHRKFIKLDEIFLQLKDRGGHKRPIAIRRQKNMQKNPVHLT